MSYRYVERDRGLRPGDIAGASLLYGARGAPRGVGSAALPPKTPADGQATHDFGLGESVAPAR